MERRHIDRSRRAAPGSLAGRVLPALPVVHPVPSGLNAVLVAVLALIARAEPAVAGVLSVAMLGFQFSIGALNDVADAEADRRSQPRKPIPAGLVRVEFAAAVVVLGAVVGLGISATFGPAVLILGLLGYGSGVAYDVGLRRRGLGWLCLAAAIPLMLAWTWLAAAQTLPPGWQFLLPLAALAGPALHLANSLVDVDSDASAGRSSLATQLGPGTAERALAVMMAAILVLAWATLLSIGAASSLAIATAAIATAATGLGVALSWQEAERAREAGWLLQAAGLAIMAAAWLASVA